MESGGRACRPCVLLRELEKEWCPGLDAELTQAGSIIRHGVSQLSRNMSNALPGLPV